MTRLAVDRVVTEPDPAHPEPAPDRGRAGHVRPRITRAWKWLNPARIRLFAQSSPGRLLGVGLLLVVLCVGSGAITAGAVHDRQRDLDILLAHTEPDANAAHRLYTSLSVADAAAATAFISGGLEPEQVRDRYSQALGEAGADLVTLSGDDAQDTGQRMGIGSGLPVYSGLVETARANNREGHPVGAAYLSEASSQMQTVLLPAAEQLYVRRAAAVDSAQDRHVRPPWFAICLLAVAVIALVWGQRLLARHWRRTFNPGLLLASGALLILMLWTVIAGSVSSVAMSSGRADGTVPAARLTESRILAQQARSAETLKLVRRDTTGDYDHAFDANITRLNELLAGHTDRATVDARAALLHWLAAHQRMNEALNRGEFTRAATIATAPGAENATAHVESLDKALGNGITETRETLRSNIFHSARVLDYLAPGALILGIAAAAYIAFGIWPRLREYR
ncbi:hypothetical protein [Nocardia jinanensis]|uniref:Secreted protein n=2 Tax=Nocardia jinanensis TaxID=382504 RepID=A0A917RUD7_9NOCA|nr:hypothetical protein [Nocardia jinanensis]GGL27705.1 hypothetical protein GCM10011588_48170 [Nocardia jinanensis]